MFRCRTSASLEEIQQYLLKNGVVYPACEIYGGLRGFYDYGYLGKALKHAFEQLWREYFLSLHDNFWEVEPSIVMHRRVFLASGHLEHFNDPVVQCTRCGEIFRADKLLEDLGIPAEGKLPDELTRLLREHGVRCPQCGGELGDVRWFNLMFPVILGPAGGQLFRLLEHGKIEQLRRLAKDFKDSVAYLRPETAQGAYVLFFREFEVHRRRLPLGLAVIGKVFRNEISPRQLLIRLREFTQAELQIFFDPAAWEKEFGEDFDFSQVENTRLRMLLHGERQEKELAVKDLLGHFPEFYCYFLAVAWKFYTEVLGVPPARVRFRELGPEERAFYNKYHVDIEIYFECFSAWKEVAGVHYRTDHDLSGHCRLAGKELRPVPHVLELSFGVDRNLLALIDIFLRKEKLPSGERTVLAIPPKLSAIQVAVFPLVSNKEEIVAKAREIYRMLKQKTKYRIFYDEKGSIGKRYRRMDEIGTPFCVTVDYQTLQDGTVTLRFRDTMQQERLPAGQLPARLAQLLE
ncbi:MAG: glycine--tRNA ligase [bacterium]|nr:glycine--tRNA ligase [bacterium]